MRKVMFNDTAIESVVPEIYVFEKEQKNIPNISEYR